MTTEDDSIEHVSILDNLDVGVQVDELRLVKDGWLEGGGKAPSPEGLGWLLDVFDRHYPDDAPLPYLYPTETGGVQAEWSLGLREASLEVNLETHFGDWHVLDLHSNEVQERTLNCDSDDDWMWLIGQLPVTPDPTPFPEHVVIDFGSCSNSEIRTKAKRLTNAAEDRGWKYRNPPI